MRDCSVNKLSRKSFLLRDWMWRSMEIERWKEKAYRILNTQSGDCRVKPWTHQRIKRASDWVGNNSKVQQIISNHLKIPR